MRPWLHTRGLEDLRREMDRLFNNWTTESSPLRRLAFLPGEAARVYPRVNLHEDGETIRVEALAPGVDPNSLDVSIQENTLIIKGEKPAALTEEKQEAYHRCERGAGRFTRTLRLGVPVDTKKVNARYRNGLLLIELHKAEEAKPRSISIEMG